MMQIRYQKGTMFSFWRLLKLSLAVMLGMKEDECSAFLNPDLKICGLYWLIFLLLLNIQMRKSKGKQNQRHKYPRK